MRKPPNTISVPIYGPVSGKRVGTRYVARTMMCCPWCHEQLDNSDRAHVLACRIKEEQRVFRVRESE